MNIKLSWEDIENLVKDVYLQINKKYDCILSIDRGGAIPSRLLSELTGIKTILHYQISYYDGEIKRKEPIIRKSYNDNDIIGKTILLVDDIADSGDTLLASLEELLKLSVDVDVAVLITKSESKFKPMYTGMELHTNAWIDFPWEAIKRK